MIKKAGENVSSVEIENFLTEHPDIYEAAVVGIYDDIEGENIKAFVILEEGKSLSEQEILDYCTDKLSRFKVPSQVEIWKSLPKTGTGKIKKSLLK